AWSRIPALGLLRSIEYREAGGERHFLDIGYPRVVGDCAGVVDEIYRRAEASLSDETKRVVAQWEAENPQHKGGRYSYSLEAFGLSEHWVEDFLGPYLTRFSSLF
ncbi:hypothetical protein, partial [Sphingomonas sp.]|uniref:hypothetical protein n=1 Tax=Sphingomonas sp. TaxID=28214 RepID=UPI0025ECFCA5